MVLGLALVGSPDARAEMLLPQESQQRTKALQALYELDQESKAIRERARTDRAACLARWVQSSCLESVRQQKARDERALLLASESLSESVRRIDAIARSRARASRQEGLNER